MNKKTIIWLSAGVAAIILIVVISVVVNNNSNEAEKQTNDLKQEREDKADETKNIESMLEIDKDEIKTKKEIADIVNEYKSEDEDLTDEDIVDKMQNEHGIVGQMYRSGLMIDEDFNEEDNRQILIKLYDSEAQYKKSEPVKEIRNPINREFGNEEDNRLIKASDIGINGYNKDKKSFIKDTEGFYEVEGLNIGYPNVETDFDIQEGEIYVNIDLLLYVEDDITKKDAKKYFDKYKDVKVNEKPLTEDKNFYSILDDFLKEYSDTGDYMYFENTVHSVTLGVSLNDLYDHDFKTFSEDADLEEAEEEIDKAFGLGEEGLDENPKININGNEIEIDDYIIEREVEGSDEVEYENDFTINPEVIGSM